MTKQLTPRRQKLVKPRYQLRLIASFAGLAGLALLLQFLLLAYRLTDRLDVLDESGELAAQVPSLLLGVLTFSVLVLVPIIFAFGILLTHRFLGPIYRFEQYLGALANGESPGVCKIREGDELQSLCSRINAAVTTLRAQSAPAPEQEEQLAA